MPRTPLLAALVLLILGTASASLVRPSSTAELEALLEPGDKPVFLAVSASWCGYCKRLKPIWEDLAAAAAAEDPNLVVAEFDGGDDAHREFVMTKYGVRGFPTIFFRPAGASTGLERYAGPREEDEFRTFLRARGAALQARAPKLAEEL